MLHTAISMEKTGDVKNAKSFYDAIIAKYPNTKYADNAKKNLTSMN
jgi:TolA-binding protein